MTTKKDGRRDGVSKRDERTAEDETETGRRMGGTRRMSDDDDDDADRKGWDERGDKRGRGRMRAAKCSALGEWWWR